MNNSKEIKQLMKEIDKAYKYIDSFVEDYCKDEESENEFYKNLNILIDNNIEIEGLIER